MRATPTTTATGGTRYPSGSIRIRIRASTKLVKLNHLQPWSKIPTAIPQLPHERTKSEFNTSLSFALIGFLNLMGKSKYELREIIWERIKAMNIGSEMLGGRCKFESREGTYCKLHNRQLGCQLNLWKVNSAKLNLDACWRCQAFRIIFQEGGQSSHTSRVGK